MEAKKTTKSKIIMVLTGIIILAAGVSLGSAGEYHYAVQVPQQKQQAIAKKLQEIRKEFRTGKVVSFSGNTITVDVEAGGGDVGQTKTYTLTPDTFVQKDSAGVSKHGQQPNLGALGLKPGYYVHLLLNGGNNVMDLQFDSDGSKTPPPPPAWTAKVPSWPVAIQQ